MPLIPIKQEVAEQQPNRECERERENIKAKVASEIFLCNQQIASHCTNLGAPSATNTRNDLFFSFAAKRNSNTVLELPKVNITSLKIHLIAKINGSSKW